VCGLALREVCREEGETRIGAIDERDGASRCERWRVR
jgi:hypothetical protein